SSSSLSESRDQRLKAAVHYTIGKICKNLTSEYEREFSRQAVAAMAEITFRQCDLTLFYILPY
uniref:Centromere protein S n=1 Tax=Astyanax mexicanus TaxID=7994 RepID=A0A8B9KEQ3_ASTMX